MLIKKPTEKPIPYTLPELIEVDKRIPYVLTEKGERWKR
jgi:hypothetical protein